MSKGACLGVCSREYVLVVYKGSISRSMSGRMVKEYILFNVQGSILRKYIWGYFQVSIFLCKSMGIYKDSIQGSCPREHVWEYVRGSMSWWYVKGSISREYVRAYGQMSISGLMSKGVF